MNKVMKYIPLVTAIIWLFCFVATFISDKANYRLMFAFTSATLVINCVVDFLGARKDDGQTEGLKNEPGRDTGYNNNDNE